MLRGCCGHLVDECHLPRRSRVGEHGRGKLCVGPLQAQAPWNVPMAAEARADRRKTTSDRGSVGYLEVRHRWVGKICLNDVGAVRTRRLKHRRNARASPAPLFAWAWWELSSQQPEAGAAPRSLRGTVRRREWVWRANEALCRYHYSGCFRQAHAAGNGQLHGRVWDRKGGSSREGRGRCVAWFGSLSALSGGPPSPLFGAWRGL